MRVGEKHKNARFAEHFIAFCNDFNILNNTVTRMLDSIYHMTFKITSKSFFVNILGTRICHIYATLSWASFHKVITNL